MNTNSDIKDDNIGKVAVIGVLNSPDSPICSVVAPRTEEAAPTPEATAEAAVAPASPAAEVRCSRFHFWCTAWPWRPGKPSASRLPQWVRRL